MGLIKLMSEIAVPEQLNSEFQVHHISSLFCIHCSKWKVYIVIPTPPPPFSLHRTDCEVLVDTSSPASAKNLHCTSRGRSNTFLLPEATHNSLHPVLSTLMRILSRAHIFFFYGALLPLPAPQGKFTKLSDKRLRYKMMWEFCIFPYHAKSLPSPAHKLMASLCCWYTQNVVQDEVQSFLPHTVCKSTVHPLLIEPLNLLNVQNRTKLKQPNQLICHFNLLFLHLICQSLLCD